MNKFANPTAVSERKSFCRICTAQCGMVLSVDENNKITGMRGDKDDPQTLGYACFKGLQAVESHYGAARILHPLKRQPDGGFARIGLEQALDEIAAVLRKVLDENGPEAIGACRGNGAYMNAAAVNLSVDFLQTLGSHKLFSPNTIDQSAKIVAAERLGYWPPGTHPFHGSEVVLMIGGNPLVSCSYFDSRNPMKRLKEAKAHGMKVIIVDPRYTETARYADLFVQPLPGEDATIVAGMIRLILERGWEDKAFLVQHAADTEKLRKAVEPFTPEYVAKRADIPVEKFRQMTEIFARAKRGAAVTATGPNMGSYSNLAEHFVGCLNVVCGRFVREGEKVNQGVINKRVPRPCQVVPATRSWDKGYKSRIGGYGLIWGELPTGIMADEMLEPGPDRIRAFINHGSNPAVGVPDQGKMVRALKSLDLLVSMEPYMTPTAKLSHYILPPYLQYERPDLPLWMFESVVFPEPFTRYTPPIATPPEGAELAEDGYVYWSLLKRLGMPMHYFGVEIDNSRPPTPDDLLAIVTRNASVPFDEIKRHELGAIFDIEPQYAEPGNPGPNDKFTFMPDDVIEETRAMLAEEFGTAVTLPTGEQATFRIAVRRHRDRWNTIGAFLPSVNKRVPYNTAMMNPDDMKALGIAEGHYVRVTSDTATVRLIAEADETLRRGVVSVMHGFGGLPGEDNYLDKGVTANLLISTDRDLQTINAMPRMSAIPVSIHPTN